MKIITILGARPQFIKAAVVSRAIQQHNKHTGNKRIKELIVHTGQHFDKNMSDVFFEDMEIPKPSRHLNIDQMSHGAMTGRMLEAIEKILDAEKPEAVLVYGDTNTTLAGALAAVKLHVPVVHVEAGLRSFNRIMPEEHNRVLTDHVSSFLFCPTRQAVNNLKREGVGEYPAPPSNHSTSKMLPQIFQVGDVMYDAALYYSKRVRGKAHCSEHIIKERLQRRKFALVTVHREENTDDDARLRAIIAAFRKIAQKIPIVWPVHPRTRNKLEEKGLNNALDDVPIIRIEAVSYFDMLGLLKNCCLVLTDSGGLQKEAYFFKKPCVTLREETEWVELAAQGFNRIVGHDTDQIVQATHEMLEADLCFDQKLYGAGDAGFKIVSILNDTLK